MGILYTPYCELDACFICLFTCNLSIRNEQSGCPNLILSALFDNLGSCQRAVFYTLCEPQNETITHVFKHSFLELSLELRDQN